MAVLEGFYFQHVRSKEPYRGFWATIAGLFREPTTAERSDRFPFVRAIPCWRRVTDGK